MNNSDHKSVFTALQELNLHDPNSININKDHQLYSYISERNRRALLYLSSNYRELFVLIDGSEITLDLPKKVDYKDERNINNANDPSLLRLFTITVDLFSNFGNTDIQFVEKSFPDLNKTYILLIGDYDYRYDVKETNNFCYQLTSDIEADDTVEPTPIIIFLCFEKETFMSQWQKVRLRNKKEDADIKGFKYEFQNWKYHFPVFNVFKSNITSPILRVNTNNSHPREPSLFSGFENPRGVEPKVNIEYTKEKKFDIPDEIRPKKILPPPITDFKYFYQEPEKSSFTSLPKPPNNTSKNQKVASPTEAKSDFFSQVSQANKAHTTTFKLPGSKK